MAEWILVVVAFGGVTYNHSAGVARWLISVVVIKTVDF